jgi:hypothetical protein
VQRRNAFNGRKRLADPFLLAANLLGISSVLGDKVKTMPDDKRLLRKIKKEVKRAGNKKRRRYLKNLAAEPGSFDFGRDRSDVMNEKRRLT